MAARTVRAEQVSATRESILTAAERLYAEQGVYAVSNRQVSEAAGQGNNAAVGYHFGTKADLVRAIVRKHFVRIEQVRLRLLAELDEESADIRDWVACLVRPLTEHLAELGQALLVRPLHRAGDDRSGAAPDRDRRDPQLPVDADGPRTAAPVPFRPAGRGARRAQ